MPFTASYAGVCEACEERIRPGDRVRYADDVLVHAGCADGVARRRSVVEEVCAVCWLVKPCGCEEE